MLSEPVRFLLVDDLEDNLNALEGLLRRDGLELHKARSGHQALELMLSNDYALALLDVQMPDMDGYELAELMRGAERTRKIPIIFLTAAAFDENRRFRGYEAGAVDYITKPIDPLILRFKSQIFFELDQKAQELARQRDEMRLVSQNLASALARLRAHVDNSPIAVVEFDEELIIRHWSQGAERMFGRKASDMETRAAHISGWLDGTQVAPLRKWLAAISEDTTQRSMLPLIATRRDGIRISCECYGSVIPAGIGGPRTLNLQILDVSERVRAEETRSMLVGELNHRVKNTLANVQAIARQTLRSAVVPQQFVETFTGRLHAFARAHSLLSDETWSGACLSDLVAEQTGLGALPHDRIRISGAPVRLSPGQTLRMALILHELTTNSVKYGALSNSTGQIDLSWEVNDGELRVRWAEHGGPSVEQPTRLGFGSTLIEANVATDGGAAKANWRPDGVVWSIALPLQLDKSGPCEANEMAPKALPAVSVGPPQAKPAGGRSLLRGKCVLVVEDEVLVAMELVAELQGAGAEIVSISSTVKQALEAVRGFDIDLAVLDGNLGGDKVDTIAEELSTRAIPFCFFSGYSREQLPPRFNHIPVVQKPFDAGKLLATLGDLFKAPDRRHDRAHSDRV